MAAKLAGDWLAKYFFLVLTASLSSARTAGRFPLLLDDVELGRADKLPKPGDPAPAAALPPSAILARRTSFLNADGQFPTALEQEAVLGSNDLVEASFIEKCRLVQQCIARIQVRSEGRTGWATGFLVGPGLLMTNHHVFPTRKSVGISKVQFGYWFNVAGEVPLEADEFSLEPNAFYVSDEGLDFAAVAVAKVGSGGQQSADKGFLRLIPETGKVKGEDFVTIMQHPDGDPMRIALRENKVLRAEDGEAFIWYQADTAHGSSGAPVFNDSFQIVALHASGLIRRDAQGRYARKNGTWVTTLDGLRESDVIWEKNLGYRVSRISEALLTLAKTEHPGTVPLIESAMAGGDVLSRAIEQTKGSGLHVAEVDTEEIEEEGVIMPDKPDKKPAASQINTVGGAGLIIPLQLRITLEGGAAAAGVAANLRQTAAAGLEEEAIKLQVPIIYDGLDERDGFNKMFLQLPGGKPVPMPKVTTTGERVLAPLLDGSGTELKYHRFSVWMHKARRLALFTASNVDWRNRKKIVDGKSTDRKTLAGFPKDAFIAEQWVDDPRIASEHQLPDIFYTDDRGAFDKGHLVRRDDMCWGTTYEDIQMSNGDTFHVTNCSPQIKAFNQGTQGEENWGDLETHIEKATKKEAETACIFSGPIFGRDDRWFHGKDDQGAARIQIPNSYWKIVVVKGAGGPQSYGFILEQDVTSITEKEFYVTDEWKGAFKPIGEIEDELRGWLKLDALKACDAFHTLP